MPGSGSMNSPFSLRQGVKDSLQFQQHPSGADEHMMKHKVALDPPDKVFSSAQGIMFCPDDNPDLINKLYFCHVSNLLQEFQSKCLMDPAIFILINLLIAYCLQSIPGYIALVRRIIR
jgi:hypothetical protein